ncbi:MAG: tRNA (pseudouridine(54)-N(1))-methyltransferase TrmY [Methanomicrobiales archaeon]|nr:tRNA (pseudouridine(54)-N(1))-methyltransferase TrmY [Methanomicrobiales archaeon]
MRTFAVVGHLAPTGGGFSLDDLPGSAGRMDILCRCVGAALSVSHGIRRDAEIHLILLGPPDPPKNVLIRGESVRSLSPDERSTAALIRKSLALPAGESFRESGPGVFVRRGDLEGHVGAGQFAVLSEAGEDVRAVGDLPPGFILSDHLDFTPGEEAALAGLPRISVGPRVLHAEHAITVLQNELDRREAGWTWTNR